MVQSRKSRLLDDSAAWELDDPVHPLTADVEPALVVAIIVVIIIAL
jgi:hypothetical protein